MPASTLGSAFAIPSLTLSQEHDLQSRGLHEILSLLLFLSTFCTFHKFSCFCWHLFCQHRDSRAAETSATPVCANQRAWVWLSSFLRSSFTWPKADFRCTYIVSLKIVPFWNFGFTNPCDNYGPTKQTNLFEMVTQKSITVQIIQTAQYSPLLGSKVVQNSHVDLLPEISERYFFLGHSVPSFQCAECISLAW